jgi:proton-dependent oligopeptide transporter, POT family
MNTFKVLKGFTRTFWVANTMELFERWAFYGFFMLFANYLTLSTDTGALGLSQVDKGIIMGVGTSILYFLPIFTGALADIMGFKRTLIFAYILYICSFLIMPHCRSFMAVFINYIFLAIGAAMFKPIVSATVARTTDQNSSSIGFGVFYMMVNIGGFIGPLVALQFSQKSFAMVFYISAILIAVNLICLIFYTEPQREVKQTQLSDAIGTILRNIITVLSDLKFLLFLLIIAGFWTMYLQLYYSLSVFITQWADTHVVYEFLKQLWPWLASAVADADGTIRAEYFTNLDAMYIIVFQLVISTIVSKFKPVNSIITGIIINAIGIGLTFSTHNGMYLFISLLIFGIGEMTASPKITEYIGKIAPPGKTALYMGFSFIPLAIGNLAAGMVGGYVYQQMSDKITFIYTEFAQRGIQVPAIGPAFTQTDLMTKACSDFQMSSSVLTQFLWEKYHPSSIWLVFVAIGIIASLALMLFNYFFLSGRRGNGVTGFSRNGK